MSHLKYYAPLPDPGAYLERIGLDPQDYLKALHPSLPESPSAYSAPHTKESMDKLVKAHLFTVPFEDLDIYDLRQEVPLGIEELFEKIVVRRRGGYCFELNGLFYALIESLGFNCYPLASRVLFEGDFSTLRHRVGVAYVEGGRRVVFDVGFAAAAPVTSLYLDEEKPQRSGKYDFIIDRKGPYEAYRQILLLPDGTEQPQLMFKDERFEPVDFVALGSFMCLNKDARFYNNRVVNLMRENGSVAIDNDMLRIHDEGQLTTVKLASPEELKKAYTEYFGMPESSLEDF